MLKKIRFKGDETEVIYFLSGVTEKTTKVSSSERRSADFDIAVMKALPDVLKYLHLPLFYSAEPNVVIQIDFSTSDFEPGLSFNLKLKIEELEAFATVKTPFLFTNYNQDIISEAEAFINNKRAQVDMFEN